MDRCVDGGHEDACPDRGDAGWVAKPFEVPGDLGDERIHERGQAVDQCGCSGCSPQQRMEPVGRVEVCDLGDEPCTQLVSFG